MVTRTRAPFLGSSHSVLALDHTRGQEDIRARFREKIALAASVIDSGAATAKLDQWVAATRA